MRIVYHVMSAPQPLGLLFVAATERGVRYLEYMDRRSLKRTIGAHAGENPGATWEHGVREMRPLAEAFEQYFCGAETDLRFPLDPVGSEFQIAVWRALLEISYGQTRTYAQIAAAAGQPQGARAAGLACNQNPITILIPCHRVIGADGKLVGYNGGVTRKKFLLGLESRFKNMAPMEGDNVIAESAVKVTAVRPAARTAAKKSSTRKPVTGGVRSSAKGAKVSTVSKVNPGPARPAPRPQPRSPAKPVSKAVATSTPRARAAAAPSSRTSKLSAAPSRRSR